MNRVELAERFAAMWRKARKDAGKSQDFVAQSLGVSKKTVQNWEDGTASPSQIKGFEFFMALGLQPLKYYLELLFPDEFVDKNPDSLSDQEVEEQLIAHIKSSTPDEQRKILYWACGPHGSSRHCVLEMLVAHLQAPLRSRLNIAESIVNNYEIAKARGELKSEKHIQPDVELLRRAIENGKEAVKNGHESYTVVVDNRFTSV